MIAQAALRKLRDNIAKYIPERASVMAQLQKIENERLATLAMVEKERQVAKRLTTQLAAYENLGSPRDIKIRLERLAKLDPNPPPSPAGAVGTIQNYDTEHDFYVINTGSFKGIKKGDKFTIFRAGRAIGKIEISRLQGTVSIGVYEKGFPKPLIPFKRGDKVVKIK